MKRKSSWIRILAVAATLTGCAGEPVVDRAPEPGPRVESAALGIALASVPPPLELREAGESSVLLAAPLPEGGEALLSIAVGPVESGGINLIEIARAKTDEFKQMPDGEAFGNRELGTQIGPAFTARGSYSEDGAVIEETWLFALHPTVNRQLTLTYRYPAGGDSAARVAEVMSVLGEVEDLGVTATP
jgi:hypothetical protein